MTTEERTDKLDVDQIIGQFESGETHTVLDAVWAILRCGDRPSLRALEPHLPRLRAIVSGLDLGGMFRRNADNAEMAFRYVEDRGRGLCRCTLYAGHNFFHPERQAEYGFVEVLSSEVRRELYEQHFRVRCRECSGLFRVREVHGWHVPWYDWQADEPGPA